MIDLREEAEKNAKVLALLDNVIARHDKMIDIHRRVDAPDLAKVHRQLRGWCRKVRVYVAGVTRLTEQARQEEREKWVKVCETRANQHREMVAHESAYWRTQNAYKELERASECDALADIITNRKSPLGKF